MSMTCTQEVEMATEIYSGVYDILHPTPIPLKNLAAMAVSLEVWRSEIIKHRTSNTLGEFWPICECISLKTILPDLPSVITDVIQEYIARFAHSLKRWLTIHFVKVFHNHYNLRTYILKTFDDFVCDYDGTVHRERTAKRMLDSDSLTQFKKFVIACTHFLEDDIRRLWPSACEQMNLNNVRIDDRTPELYYWICCLRNELEKITILTDQRGDSVDEIMLQKCMLTDISRQSVRYFWDRVPLERRMKTAANCLQKYFGSESFVKVILPKLDEEELAEFVNENGVELMHSLLKHFRQHDVTLVLSTWMYIRNIMNMSQITDLVVEMLQSEGGYDMDKWLCLCFEILNNIPLDSKPTIIRTILSNNNNVLVESINAGSEWWRTFEILLGILSCVTFEERNEFWHHYWRVLIRRARCEDLNRIMDICFENEEKIAEFKENITIENESVRDACVFLLGRRFFDELNELVSFCYPDTEKARRFKQQLLQSAFFGESCCFSIEFLNVSKELNEFIDDAYENTDLSTDFKIQLMSLPTIQFRLSQYARARKKVYKQLMEFIDIFVPKEQCALMQQIKTGMNNAVKEELIGNGCNTVTLNDSLRKRSLKTFVLWCLGSEDEVEKFQLECVSEFEQRQKMLR